jgi:hypothetical protein
LRTGIADVTPHPVTGTAVVAGYDVHITLERCFEAAGISCAPNRENWDTVCGWLRADLEPNDFVAVIRRIASRPGGDRPRLLRYFDRAVREECKPTGYAKRLA